MKLNQIISLLGSVAMAMVFIITALIGHDYFIASPPLVYANLPFPAATKDIYAGEVVPLIVKRCNTTGNPINYTVSHSIVNTSHKLSYVLPGPSQQDVYLSPGCETNISLLNKLPPDLPPGEYQIYGGATVQGALRQYFLTWYSEPFVVLETHK